MPWTFAQQHISHDQTDRSIQQDFHDIELRACMGHQKHIQGYHEIEDHCVFGDALSLIIHTEKTKPNQDVKRHHVIMVTTDEVVEFYIFFKEKISETNCKCTESSNFFLVKREVKQYKDIWI